MDVLFDQLSSLFNSAGFSLHKWCSNSEESLLKISSQNASDYEIKADNVSNKFLGIKWHPATDDFGVSIPKKPFNVPITKRKNILSWIAQCFDPLGFLSPIIVTGKLLMQRIWTLKLDWDSVLTDQSLINDWRKFANNLHLLETLKIPRFILNHKKSNRFELHGFADASLNAYAAVVHLIPRNF